MNEMYIKFDLKLNNLFSIAKKPKFSKLVGYLID